MPRRKQDHPTQVHQAPPPDAQATQAGAGEANEPTFTLRIRHSNGTDRIMVRPSQTVGTVRRKVSEILKIAAPSRVQLFSDMACTEALGDDDESLGPFGLALSNGDMLTMKEKPTAAARKKAAAAAEGAAEGAAPAKRAKKAAGKGGGVYLREGKTPRDIAVAFMTQQHQLGGEAAYSQMSAAARVDAVESGRVELALVQKGGKSSLSVQFTGNRKDFEERGPVYSADELVAVFAEIISRQTTSSRRTATSASHLLNAGEIARRSPAIFWSVFALSEEGASYEDRLAHVIGLAQAALAGPA
jgi:hypothetical protein